MNAYDPVDALIPLRREVIAPERELEDYEIPDEIDDVPIPDPEPASPRAKPPAEHSPAAGLKTTTWCELTSAADADPPVQVVQGHVGEGEVVVVHGFTGVGKSVYMIEMGAAIDRGERFLGQFATLKSKVGIIDEESDPRPLGRRLKQWARGRALEAGDDELPVFAVGQGVRLDTPAGVEAVYEWIVREQLSVVIIDTLRRVHRLRENEADDMAKIEAAVKTLQRRVRRELGRALTVVLIHHSPKPRVEGGNAPETMARGSGDILGGADTAFYLRRGKGVGDVIAEQSKARWAEKLPPYRVRIEGDDEEIRVAYVGTVDETSGQQERAEEIALEVLRDGAGPRTKDELVARGEAAKVSRRSIERALKAFEDRGEVIRGKFGRKATYELTEAGLLG